MRNRALSSYMYNAKYRSASASSGFVVSENSNFKEAGNFLLAAQQVLFYTMFIE